MDGLSLLGILLAVTAILGGQFLEGGSIHSLLNGPALLIVGGGTLGAILLQTPMPVFWRALKLLRWIVFPPRYPIETSIQSLLGWSQIARKEGLLGLERLINTLPDPFVRKGMGLLVDGNESEKIRSVMQMERDLQEDALLKSAKVFDAMGGYTPTLGIIGAVIGLIQVMGHLSEPEKLGNGIATAFVATVYGIAFANLLLLPIGGKLKSLIQAQALYRDLIIEGLVAIAEGQNPRIIEMRLAGFVEAMP